jgi:hypothetical protein
MDLALRFLTLRNVSGPEVGDVHDFLRDRMEEIATDDQYPFDHEETLFREVFSFLDAELDANSFRSWSAQKQEFRGGFSLGAFEGIAITLGKNWPAVKKRGAKFDASAFVKEVWSQPEYKKSFSGLRARERMARVLPAAERVMSEFLSKGTKKKAKS